jgi:hypothetical protein
MLVCDIDKQPRQVTRVALRVDGEHASDTVWELCADCLKALEHQDWSTLALATQAQATSTLPPVRKRGRPAGTGRRAGGDENPKAAPAG